MDKPFEITFDFPMEHSLHTISLKAIVQLHHSETYYVIDSFYFAGTRPGNSSVSLLPRTELRYLKATGKGVWVHKDSLRESLLSRSIGKAIEESGFWGHE